MALTQTPFPNPLQVGLVFDDAANSTTDLNIQGADGVRLHCMEIVNTGGAATTNYVKLYDANSVTPGTTAPDFILPTVAATTRTYFFYETSSTTTTVAGVTTIREESSGVTFETGLSERCVQNAGTPGTTNPGDTVAIGFWTSEIS